MNLKLIHEFSRKKLENERSGHDWLHALRVEKNALEISQNELSKKEIGIIKASSWLHDTIDPKIISSKKGSIYKVKEILQRAEASKDEINEITSIIQNISYSKNIEKKQKLSFLGKIVQDADRLDAIGAIGIARTFYYGGSKGHSLYTSKSYRSIEDITEENYREQNSVINHFYEKLLHLESLMNTENAKKIAHDRTNFMKLFLKKFKEETKNENK